MFRVRVLMQFLSMERPGGQGLRGVNGDVCVLDASSPCRLSFPNSYEQGRSQGQRDHNWEPAGKAVQVLYYSKTNLFVIRRPPTCLRSQRGACVFLRLHDRMGF